MQTLFQTRQDGLCISVRLHLRSAQPRLWSRSSDTHAGTRDCCRSAHALMRRMWTEAERVSVLLSLRRSLRFRLLRSGFPSCRERVELYLNVVSKHEAKHGAGCEACASAKPAHKFNLLCQASA